jgi:hypothetical protein
LIRDTKVLTKKDAGDRVDFNAELTSWLHSFTPAINMYLRNELKYKTDFTYNMFGPVPWDNSNDNTEKTCVRRWLKSVAFIISTTMMVLVIILMPSTNRQNGS